MKRTWLIILAFLLWIAPSAMQAQFVLATNGNSITIVSYDGPGGNVVIPSVTNNLPVATIGPQAFYGLARVTGVTIPGSVTNIGQYAFYSCTGMTNVTIPV